MRARVPLDNAVRSFRQLWCQGAGPLAKRAIHISATPTTETPNLAGDVFSSSIESASDPADARFEVLGAPYSLLSVSLSASQKLYTRRGTLVGISGKSENAQSTLSILEPFRRAPLGVPFLYQRISSTTPITALISTKSPITSFTVIHLNGTVDWMVAQRKALLAWTGHTLSVTPTMNSKMSLAHWGNTEISGRGLVALAGPGNIYQINLRSGEEYVAHPGNVVAYTITQNQPLPYRLKSSSLRFQVPSLGSGYLVPNTKFFKAILESQVWKGITSFLYTLRTTARRTIWGDSLFMKFHGPITILMSSRASRISEVLTSRDINEIADSPPGAVGEAVTLMRTPKETVSETTTKVDVPTGFHTAEVGKDGKVKFGEVEDMKPFIRS